MAELVHIQGGTFRMGSNDFYPDERPEHERSVESFFLEQAPVTNAEFADFVGDTGYVTVAERSLDLAEFPGADPADLVPGAMVFTPPSRPVDLGDWRNWWRWQPGAMWRHPSGPDSTIDDRLDHPVVHVAFEDACAYANWLGLRLPTEAEFEFAARGGLDGAPYAWGDEPYPDGKVLANVWIGSFPHENRGWGGTSPIGAYPPNPYDLVDLIGNVWEWTSDYYIPRHIQVSDKPADRGERQNLLAAASAEPIQPRMPRRVLKGGSQLCSPDYCLRFRPAARSPQAEDTAMSHVGFRCARDA
ncbi:formylglycine-generating enzyme family protein [Arthrobacter sp. OV608]|jgi:sulfatase modifying factor 1|uniref:formylglycine-generating enzyme family protein n=1 Tax=Arthrobacter sp. OV608 TaxID=1882768 RepID=UPI0008B9F206|nr:formylglycine-generating enzyme family protein [Arthrobacter sp. OV608]SEQ15380.1 Formylglycine-generating enzyme, required for sulfatase activity, contains SUMF1/FGE domain [Arthrobacter sp. OV608]